MADKKISELNSASLPLAGSELVPIVQGGETKKVAVNEIGGGIPDAPNNANAYVRSALSWVVGYTKTAIDTLLGNKVDANAPITGTVKTKITYDSKGLVTAGADALTSDIADSLNRRYVTDAQLVVIGNTSGTNTGDNATNSQYSGLATSKQDVLTETNFGSFSTALTSKTTPVDADSIPLSDSADSNKAKKTTWLNVWTNYLKPKADLLYQPIFSYVPIKSIVADYTNSSGVTGTASETLISSYKINANTLSALDFMNMTLRLLKTGTTAGYLITIRVGTTSTFSTSLTQIAQYGNTLSTGADVNFQRYFKIEGGSLKGSNFTFNILGNQGVSVNYTEGSTSFDVSVDNWIFISVKPQSSNSDVITQSIFKITN